jgi:hypothetical protein
MSRCRVGTQTVVVDVDVRSCMHDVSKWNPSTDRYDDIQERTMMIFMHDSSAK